MPGKRRENAVQKMLVTKQMLQVVEVHSPIQDRWLTTAQVGGRGARSRLAEAYSSASRQRAGAFGLSAGVAMDLRLGWDLGQRAEQVKAEKRLTDEKPHLFLLSPTCLSLSRLQHTKPDELAELREQGKRHLEFACSLARLQIERGGRVLFEYPFACGS